jgi:hypothetical protein
MDGMLVTPDEEVKAMFTYAGIPVPTGYERNTLDDDGDEESVGDDWDDIFK